VKRPALRPSCLSHSQRSSRFCRAQANCPINRADAPIPSVQSSSNCRRGCGQNAKAESAAPLPRRADLLPSNPFPLETSSGRRASEVTV
jgi:hypothetical protein